MYCVNEVPGSFLHTESTKPMTIIRDSYRILGLGWETQHLGGSGGMFPQENVLKTNALRLIMGHFLVHMHTLANTYPCKIDVFCCNYTK